MIHELSGLEWSDLGLASRLGALSGLGEAGWL